MVFSRTQDYPEIFRAMGCDFLDKKIGAVCMAYSDLLK
jgi:hypothetical protein